MKSKAINSLALLTLSIGAPLVHAQMGLNPLASLHIPTSPTACLNLILEYFLKQRMGNTLPLSLNAEHAYPAVENSQLPGGPFHGTPLDLNAQTLSQPLAPGDYTVTVMSYCTQYSVHRPGQGTAYKLAPLEGTEAEVIATLLWRGTLLAKPPQILQATNWAIQSGLTYSKMPKPYQQVIDELIPDYKGKLKGNLLQETEDTYRMVGQDPRLYLQTYIQEKYNKKPPLMLLPKIAIPVPPLDRLLLSLGVGGHLLLDAKMQSNIFLTAYTNQEKGEQVLFAHQGTVLPPEPASEAPWTIRVPGVAWLRFKVEGGNLQGNNIVEIRILPAQGDPAADPAAVPRTSVFGLLGVNTAGDPSDADASWIHKLTASGIIGYSQGGNGAQALIPVNYLAAAHGPATKTSRVKTPAAPPAAPGWLTQRTERGLVPDAALTANAGITLLAGCDNRGERNVPVLRFLVPRNLLAGNPQLPADNRAFRFDIDGTFYGTRHMYIAESTPAGDLLQYDADPREVGRLGAADAVGKPTSVSLGSKLTLQFAVPPVNEAITAVLNACHVQAYTPDSSLSSRFVQDALVAVAYIQTMRTRAKTPAPAIQHLRDNIITQTEFQAAFSLDENFLTVSDGELLNGRPIPARRARCAEALTATLKQGVFQWPAACVYVTKESPQ